MQAAVAQLDVANEFARSTKRFRLLLASSLSIFVFTFQGSVEAALSTFDCKEVNGMFFLRINPRIRCDSEDEMYVRMIATTITGLAIYCFVLPMVTIITLRSDWCRETYIHDNTAYAQMFGFLTSIYTRTCSLWELVSCVRKVVYVAVPVLISRDALVQSVLIFFWLITYTLAITKIQPLASSHLNQLEVLSCISVIVGSFSSIFFVIEYQGLPVLSGAARDLAGLFLVIVCAICAVSSLRLMRKDYSSNFCVCAKIQFHSHATQD